MNPIISIKYWIFVSQSQCTRYWIAFKVGEIEGYSRYLILTRSNLLDFERFKDRRHGGTFEVALAGICNVNYGKV